MNFVALAADYDGTIAKDGRVDAETVEAFDLLKSRGKKLILVTGRELPELKSCFPELDMFDIVIAENGALMYRPFDGSVKELGPRPPEALIGALKASGVAPMSVGS